MTAFPCGSWGDFQEGKCLSCEGACPQMGYNAGQHRVNKSVMAFLETKENQPFCGMQELLLHSVLHNCKRSKKASKLASKETNQLVKQSATQ